MARNIAIEELENYIGGAVWFRQPGSDLNCGTLKSVRDGLARIEVTEVFSSPVSYFATVEATAQDVYPNAEALLADNAEMFKAISGKDEKRNERVKGYQKKLKTVQGLAELYKDYYAMKSALLACSMDLMGTEAAVDMIKL